MSLTLSTNLSSIKTQRSLKQSSISLNQAIERMTTGYKINHAKDNAANYSIATNMSSKISAYEIAESNTSMGLDMVQTASDTLSLMNGKLNRMRALAVQLKNGTQGDFSKSVITSEILTLGKEVAKLYETAEYNGIKLYKYNSETIASEEIPEAKYDGFIQKVEKRDTASMTPFASVDKNATLSSGTYSISTADELAKLATMTNNGKIGANTEFVLASDIDLSQYENWIPIGDLWYDGSVMQGASFKGVFDGNGFVISNLKINNDKNYQALFGKAKTIKNLGVENAQVRAKSAGIIGGYDIGNITNCYSSGQVSAEGIAGGISMLMQLTSKIDNCYSTAEVYATRYAGGLVGHLCNSMTNSFFKGAVGAAEYAGYLCGGALNGSNIKFENCYADFGNDDGNFIGIIRSNTKNSININNCSYSSNLERKLVGVNESNFEYNVNNITFYEKREIKTGLQIGIKTDNTNQISFSSALVANKIKLLASVYIDTPEAIDSVIEMIQSKQTELGALENRLTSALEEISINYENLVSSRSTIKDADIAEVSSEYIRNQILQQASATLMSTANQTPAIALRLL